MWYKPDPDLLCRILRSKGPDPDLTLEWQTGSRIQFTTAKMFKESHKKCYILHAFCHSKSVSFITRNRNLLNCFQVYKIFRRLREPDVLKRRFRIRSKQVRIRSKQVRIRSKQVRIGNTLETNTTIMPFPSNLIHFTFTLNLPLS